MTDNSGTFVTLEGIDGSGKTSAAQVIRNEWDSVVQTQEPSDLWTGEQVRRAISSKNASVHPLTTFFLFMADRNHHIQERIQGALNDGSLVISDRYSDSTLAYQRRALDQYVENPDDWMERCMDPWNLEPDLTIYLDISVETAIERSVGDEEYENAEFLTAVKSNYEDVRKRFNHRYCTVDAEQPINHVQKEVLQIVEAHYQN